MAKHLLHIVLIALLTGLFYAPSLQNDFIWDDDDYVYNNLAVQSPAGLSEIWFSREMPQYYPMVFTTFWVEHKLWGLDPFGYHVVNLALHIVNALLIYLVMLQLAPSLALAVALLFALHPVQVETVAWVTERKNLLGCLFYLLAILSWLKFSRTTRPTSYLCALAAFVLALLSKSIAVTFVVVPLFLKWWRGEKLAGKDLVALLPFAVVGAGFAANTIYLEMYKVGAQGEAWALSLSEHLVLAGQIALFYIYKILLPVELVFFYPKWQLDAHQPLQWLPLVAVIALGGLLYRFRGTMGRGAFASYLYFLCAIFPALGFFNVYPMMFSYVADHFQYIASINLVILLAGAGAFLYQRAVAFAAWRPAPRTGAAALYLVLGVLAGLYGAKVLDHSRSFKDLETQWVDVIRKNDRSWTAYNNLGLVYQQQGKGSEAIAAFKKAIAIAPDNAQARNNLGIYYYLLDRPEEALAQFEQVLAIDPGYANAYVNIGLIYLNAGRVELAGTYFFKAVELNPRLAEGHFNLAEYYLARYDIDKAIGELQKTLELSPGFIDAMLLLGQAHEQLGQFRPAELWYRRAIDGMPGLPAAHTGLGVVYLAQDKLQEAIGEFRVALQGDPEHVDALMNLGFAYMKSGAAGQAIPLFFRARSLGVALPADVVQFIENSRAAEKAPGGESR